MATYTNTDTLYDNDGNVIACTGKTFSVVKCYTSCGYRWVDLMDNEGNYYNVREDAMTNFFMS